MNEMQNRLLSIIYFKLICFGGGGVFGHNTIEDLKLRYFGGRLNVLIQIAQESDVREVVKL